MSNFIFFFSNNITTTKQQYCQNLINNFIDSYDIKNSISSDEKFIFTLGGDGTFLEAYSTYGEKYIYIPINMGSLGFYTSWTLDSIELLFENFTTSKMINAPLLKISYLENKKKVVHHCLNEATIINPIRTQILDIIVNNIYFENFRGTGICLSTPTGSTAYNKSLNGAILDPGKSLFQLVKIAPINNKEFRTLSNPIIFDEKDDLILRGTSHFFKNSILTIDRKNFPLDNIEELSITLSNKKVKIMTSSNLNFWKRVHNSFLN